MFPNVIYVSVIQTTRVADLSPRIHNNKATSLDTLILLAPFWVITI